MSTLSRGRACMPSRWSHSSCSPRSRSSSPRARPTRRTTTPIEGVGWLRPVDGPVVHPFEEPASVYAAGHRGADLAAAPGTPVRAANDGVVSFAGDGRRHAARHRRPRRRSAHVVLVPLRGVGAHRASGGARRRARHHRRYRPRPRRGGVLHLGLRVGDRYVDPMQLFRPDDLTKLVHLVPADEPGETPWSPERERRDLQASLRLPSLVRADRARTPTPTTATPTCRSSATRSTRCATSAPGSATTPAPRSTAGSTSSTRPPTSRPTRSTTSAPRRSTPWRRCSRSRRSPPARSRTRRPARSPSTSSPSAGASPTA